MGRWWFGLSCGLFSFAFVLSSAQDGAAELPRLHVLTFCNTYDPRLILPLSTAYKQGVAPLVVGLDGVEIVWGTGMGHAFNVYRSYVFNSTEPDDLVLFFDAYDVMFQGGRDELIETYLRIERRTLREIVYNGDVLCSSPRKADYPPCDTPWRYLNCGVYMGRSRALRQLMQHPLPDKIRDRQGKPMRLQNYHTEFYLEHQDLVLVDTACELVQAITYMPSVHLNRGNPLRPDAPETLGSEFLEVSGGRLYNRKTNTSPPMLHFPGPAHWPDEGHEERVGTCLVYEYFRKFLHSDLARTMERQALVLETDHNYGQVPWRPICTVYLTFFDLRTFELQHLGDNIVWLYWHPYHAADALVTLWMMLMVGYLLYLAVRRWICPSRRNQCLIDSRVPGTSLKDDCKDV